MFLNGFLWSFLRRWYGGMYGDILILKSRGVQTVVMIAAMAIVAIQNNSLLFAIFASIFIQIQFWSRGHGACFDIGRGEPSEETIKRYKERWYYKPLEILFNRLKASEHKYGFLYDFLYMGMRYSFPMIFLSFISHFMFNMESASLIIIGLAISPIYAFNWTMYEKEPWFYEILPNFCKDVVKFSEILSGFIFGIGFYYFCQIAN